mmetsp:Transcript_13830/g.20996  ORF Transcript_13830/g.20996 Transcript_13830/m.20996 type:complete len:212 (-) Transcript_13830:195-830(-)
MLLNMLSKFRCVARPINHGILLGSAGNIKGNKRRSFTFGGEMVRRIDPDYPIWFEDLLVKIKVVPPTFKVVPGKLENIKVLDRQGGLTFQFIRKEGGTWQFRDSESIMLNAHDIGDLVSKLERAADMSVTKKVSVPQYGEGEHYKDQENDDATNQYKELTLTYKHEGSYKVCYGRTGIGALQAELRPGDVEVVKAIARESITYITGFRDSF